MKTRALGLAAVALCVMVGAGPEDRPFGGQPGTAAKPAAKSPSTAAVVKAASGAAQTVQIFVAHARKGECRRGVDECFDADLFSRTNLAGYSKLNVTDRAYVRQMIGVLFKSMLADSPIEAVMTHELKGPLNVIERGDEASVVLEFVNSPGRIPIKLAKTPNGWRIVDVLEMGERLKVTSKTSKIELTQCVEAMLCGALTYKHNPAAMSNFEQNRLDAIGGNLRAQTKSIQNQIELYKARTGHYPDLVKDGWSVLLKDGYIKKEPVNPVNESALICESGRRNPNAGWEYDLETGTFGACFFDEREAKVTTETP